MSSRTSFTPLDPGNVTLDALLIGSSDVNAMTEPRVPSMGHERPQRIRAANIFLHLFCHSLLPKQRSQQVENVAHACPRLSPVAVKTI